MKRHIEFRPKKHPVTGRYKIYRIEGTVRQGVIIVDVRKVVVKDIPASRLEEVLYKLDSTKKI